MIRSSSDFFFFVHCIYVTVAYILVPYFHIHSFTLSIDCSFLIQRREWINSICINNMHFSSCLIATLLTKGVVGFYTFDFKGKDKFTLDLKKVSKYLPPLFYGTISLTIYTDHTRQQFPDNAGKSTFSTK